MRNWLVEYMGSLVTLVLVIVVSFIHISPLYEIGHSGRSRLKGYEDGNLITFASDYLLSLKF